jgi:hypothetical protein
MVGRVTFRKWCREGCVGSCALGACKGDLVVVTTAAWWSYTPTDPLWVHHQRVYRQLHDGGAVSDPWCVRRAAGAVVLASEGSVLAVCPCAVVCSPVASLWCASATSTRIVSMAMGGSRSSEIDIVVTPSVHTTSYECTRALPPYPSLGRIARCDVSRTTPQRRLRAKHTWVAALLRHRAGPPLAVRVCVSASASVFVVRARDVFGCASLRLAHGSTSPAWVCCMVATTRGFLCATSMPRASSRLLPLRHSTWYPSPSSRLPLHCIRHLYQLRGNI